MTDPGVLPEKEIRDYISQKLGANITPEALAKPTKEFAKAIYSLILDSFGYNWKELAKDAAEIILLTREIRRFTSLYNPNFTFQASDLLAPTRKRTALFLSTLINVHYLADQVLKSWVEKDEQQSSNLADYEKLKNTLEQVKSEGEDLLARKGSLPTKEELECEYETLHSNFSEINGEAEEAQKLAEVLKDQKNIILSELDEMKQDFSLAQQRHRVIVERYQMLERARIEKEAQRDVKRKFDTENRKLKEFEDLIQKQLKISEALDKLIKKAESISEDPNFESIIERHKAEAYRRVDKLQQNNDILKKLEESLRNTEEEDERLRRLLAKTVDQKKIKEEEFKKQLIIKKKELQEAELESKGIVSSIEEQLNKLKKHRMNLTKSINERKHAQEQHIQEMNQQLSITRKTYQDMKESLEKSKPLREEYKSQLRSFLGIEQSPMLMVGSQRHDLDTTKPQSQQQQSQQSIHNHHTPANRTYDVNFKNRTYEVL